MAQHPSAEKRVRNSQRKNSFHAQIKGQIRSLEKRLRGQIKDKNQDQAQMTLKSLLSYLDKASQTAGFHKNKSARKKSQVTRVYNREFKKS